MLWTFYVGFSHLPMSMGHHNTTRPAISVVFLRKAQCQAYLISFFFFLFRFVERHRTQYTLYVFVVVVKMSKTKSNGTWTRNRWLMHQCNQLLVSGVSRWKNKEQGQRLLFVLKHSIAISCFVRTETATYACSRLKNQWVAFCSQNSGWSTHSTHCFKNSVQRAKLTVLKVIQNDFSFFKFWWDTGTQYTLYVFELW